VAFCFVIAPDHDFESIEGLNELTNRIWQRMTVDGREDINQYSFLLSRTEVSVPAYEHVLDDLLPPDVLAEAVADDASLTLLRTCLMNPFQADWNAEDDAPFADRVADFLYDVAVEEYLEQVVPPVPRGDTERHPVLVVEQSPRAQGGLARHLEHDEKVVAHFDVRSRSAADLQAAQSNGLVDAAEDVVVHLDAEAPSRMLHLLRHLVENHRLPPERLTAVVTGTAAAPDLHQNLADLGLSGPAIIAEADLSMGARRLIMQLSTHRDAAPVT
jgi:hypothetical protein